MNVYKALILDIDGTIIPNYEECEPTLKVLEALKHVQKSAKVIFATGRSAADGDPIIKKLYDGTPYIYINGARIEVPLNKQVIDSFTLTSAIAERVFAIAQKNEVYAYTEKGTILVHSNPKYESDYEKVAPQNLTESYSLGVTNLDTKEFDRVYTELGKLQEINLGWTHAWNPELRDITVTHGLATKRHALRKLLNLLEISPEQTIAVGDGGNDLPLFEVSGLPIAMENAPESVKSRAKLVAPSVSEDGVAWIVEKYF